MQSTNRGGGGDRRACYVVTPDQSYDCEGERKRRARIINGMQKKRRRKKRVPSGSRASKGVDL